MLQNQYKGMDFIPNNQKKTHKKRLLATFLAQICSRHAKVTTITYSFLVELQ